MNSRAKGARGERQWRDQLRAEGYAARRGQQFSGSPDSPDVICEQLPFHFEVKCVEKLNLYDAVAQAVTDAGSKTPVVAHKRNHGVWLVTMLASDWFKLVREAQPTSATPDQTLCSRCNQKPAGQGICPYRADINGVESECDCCADCRHECLMDI